MYIPYDQKGSIFAKIAECYGGAEYPASLKDPISKFEQIYLYSDVKMSKKATLEIKGTFKPNEEELMKEMIEGLKQAT